MVQRSVSGFGRPLSVLGLAIGLSAIFLSMTAPDAEARSRHKRGYHSGHRVSASFHIRRHAVRGHRAVRSVGRRALGADSTPMFASIVVDANSGRMLTGRNENELRHPASITKVMTLYLLFEQLDKGRMKLDGEIPISAHAASQAPSKLGLRPGSTIEVEDAIKALVTKSANDIAVAIAESIGSDEDTFAEQMTRKARALGMSRTVYRNASGLPDDEQVTTARDLSILGRSLQDRFPKYYRYFSTRVFNYGRAAHRNHNHLLGRVEGMDGIKTGYTRASGFNLLTSVKRDGHHIVAVVLGGRTGGIRDRIMADLIESNIENGATSRTAVAMTEGNAEREDVVAKAEPVRPEPLRAEPVRQEAKIEPKLEPMRAEPVREAREPLRLQLARADTPVEPLRYAARRNDSEGSGLNLAVPLAPMTDKPRPAFVSGAPRVLVDDSADRNGRDRARTALDGSTARPTSTRVVAASSHPIGHALGDGRSACSAASPGQSETRSAARTCQQRVEQDNNRDCQGRTGQSARIHPPFQLRLDDPDRRNG